MTNRLIFIIYKSLDLYNRSFKPISSPSPTLLFAISISCILLSISLTSKGNLLAKAVSSSNIISLSINLGRRVVWSSSLLKDPLYIYLSFDKVFIWLCLGLYRILIIFWSLGLAFGFGSSN
jgi:hypothetical protein